MSEIEKLITKAAEAPKASDAMMFSQAACNASKALCELETFKSLKADNERKSNPVTRTD